MALRIVQFPSPSDLVVFANSAQEVSGVAIADGGLGYAEDDVLFVVGGTGELIAKITVSSVDGSGTITGAAVAHEGAYTTAPSNPVSVTGGTGSGATFNLTLGDAVEQADVKDIKESDGRWYLLYYV